MTGCRILIAGVLLMLVAACSAKAPALRIQASSLVDDLARQGASEHIARDYQGIVETFEHGEALYHVRHDDREADRLYQMVLQKGQQASRDLSRIRERIAADELRRAAEDRARAEEEHLMREAARAEEELREQAQREAAEEAARTRQQRSQEGREVHRRLSSYTVKRGETLPQIAGRPEIYGNTALWPLIYRANRDQISDPKRLWPGQVLAIPRAPTR